MTDLFLEPKVLDYQGDRYLLILHTLRWARALKTKGSPDPMPVLIERALRDIIEKKITFEEILANKVADLTPAEDIPAVVSVADDGKSDELKAALAEEAEEEKKKAKKKKKKDD